MLAAAKDKIVSVIKSTARFGLDPAVKQSGKFNGDKVHMSKRGSSLARRILHMVALNNLKVDKGTKSPVNPVIYDYYTGKCVEKKKNVAVGAVMHKICNIIFAMLRDIKVTLFKEGKIFYLFSNHLLTFHSWTYHFPWICSTLHSPHGNPLLEIFLEEGIQDQDGQDSHHRNGHTHGCAGDALLGRPQLGVGSKVLHIIVHLV